MGQALLRIVGLCYMPGMCQALLSTVHAVAPAESQK